MDAETEGHVTTGVAADVEAFGVGTNGHPAARGIGKSGKVSSCVSTGALVMTLLGGGKEAEDIEPGQPDNSPSDGYEPDWPDHAARAE